MPIKIEELKKASGRTLDSSYYGMENLKEALASKIKTAFLCHSHKDKDLAKGLQVIFQENGLKLYIDWQDEKMPDQPDKITAERIKSKIKSLNLFIFLATKNSTESKWCPWEIGYADAAKFRNDIIIIATQDNSGNFYGNEYLRLYRQISETAQGGYGLFEADSGNGGTILAHVNL
jgi:metal-dependent hydrolase (beta-lactamase superfamily II)